MDGTSKIRVRSQRTGEVTGLTWADLDAAMRSGRIVPDDEIDFSEGCDHWCRAADSRLWQRVAPPDIARASATPAAGHLPGAGEPRAAPGAERRWDAGHPPHRSPEAGPEPRISACAVVTLLLGLWGPLSFVLLYRGIAEVLGGEDHSAGGGIGLALWALSVLAASSLGLPVGAYSLSAIGASRGRLKGDKVAAAGILLCGVQLLGFLILFLR